jgi:PAS domain S-box-containing protein
MSRELSRDVERALAEARAANQKLEAIIEASPLGIITLDAAGLVKSWNPAAERIYGWTEDEVLDRPLPTVPPSLRAEMERNHDAAVRGEHFSNYETVRVRKDGSRVEVSISTAPIFDAEGNAEGVLALIADITERKRAEAALAHQAATLREQASIIEQAYDAIILRDPSKAITLWNRGAERMYGFTQEEARGRSPHELLATEFPIPLEEIYALLRRDGYWEGKLSHARKDGERIVVESRWATIRNEGGEVTSILEINRDITERTLAEAKLFQLAAIIESSDDAIFSKNLDGVIQSWNPAAERLYGYTAEEAVGQPVTMLIPPDRPGEEPQIIGRIKRGERVDHYETVRVRKDGTLVDVSLTVSPVKDAGGLIIGASNIARDITERKRVGDEQKFLSDATTMLASSLDYASTLDAVAHMATRYLADYCLVDLLEDDGAITRLVVAHNDPAREAAWREMQRRFPLDPAADYTIPHVLRTGESLLYFDPTDEMIERALSDPEHIQTLKRLGIVSSMIVPLKARGRTLGAITFVSAESGRRYTERDLRVAEEMARRAALAIDNARLFERAQEANRAKDEFLATLSHELRTPLTPIVGWVHLLGGGQIEPDDFKHGLGIIDKNSKSLSRLINDLLDMSAILNGKMRIDHSPVLIGQVMREAVETVRAQADRRGIRIELTGCDDDNLQSLISGDRTRLVQVFWNLLTNAAKFSDDGATVRVSCKREEASLVVSVEDDGIGIAPDFLPHVFDRFQQADMSTTKLYGGLGIGLALVRSFIEAHGGTVHAESAGLGCGSRFTIRLPVAELRKAALGLRGEE